MSADQPWQVAVCATDTVWGLVSRIDTPEAQQNIQRIYAIKEREASKPLILFGSCLEVLRPYAAEWSEVTEALATQYWPGALTIIVRRSSLLPDWVNPGEEYIGLRVPNSPSVMQLLSETRDGLLLSTSANLSGEEPVRNYQEACLRFSQCERDLSLRGVHQHDEATPSTSLRGVRQHDEAIHYVDLIIEPFASETLSNSASTIVKISNDKIEILRQGDIKI